MALRFWRTDSTAGGDGTEDRTDGATRAYESLAAAVTAEAADLVSATDAMILRCTTAGTVDTTQVSINGYTLNATYDLTIECTGDAHHQGVSRSNGGTGYQLLVTDSSPTISVVDSHVTIRGLESGANTVGKEAIEMSTGAVTTNLDQCIFIHTSATVDGNEIVNNLAGDLNMTNCLVISGGARGMNCTVGTNVIDHCGFIGGGTLGILADDSSTFTNTYVVGYTTEDFWSGAASPAGSHNASLDGTAQTEFTSSVDIVANANEFTTPSTDPTVAVMTLLDSLLNEAGTGSESVDITGGARSGTADIGPYNYSVGGGGGASLSQLGTYGMNTMTGGFK